MSEGTFQSFVEKKIPGLFFILMAFAIIEFGILMVCLLLSGNQDVVRVYNPANTLVYEDKYDTTALSKFETVSGITNFKDEGYIVTRTVIKGKFPTRSWIALSVCVPIVLILFVVFIVRVFEDVFLPKKEKQSDMEKSQPTSDFDETRFEKLFSTLSRLNIYALGVTAISIGFLYWMIPDLIVYLGKISYQTISELKWVIMCMVIFGSIYLIFRTFLSYKTKIEIVRQQSEIQKNRDRLTIENKSKGHLLENKQADS
ncbi:MAG: hypothetical protein ABIJ59_02435 [Pseudomonadota bacterium]